MRAGKGFLKEHCAEDTQEGEDEVIRYVKKTREHLEQKTRQY